MITAMLSVGGAPGVTAAAVAATVHAVRPTILVEADTSKTSDVVAGLLHAREPLTRGLSRCLAAATSNALSPDLILREQLLPLGVDERWLLPGFDSVLAAQHSDVLWPSLATSLRAIAATGRDIILDLGRWRSDDPRVPMLEMADVIVLFLRPRRPEVINVVEHLDYLRPLLQRTGRVDRIALALVATPEPSYSAREVSAVEAIRLPVLATLPDDQRSATVYSLGADPHRRLAQQPYARAIAALGTAAQEHARRLQQDLEIDPATAGGTR